MSKSNAQLKATIDLALANLAKAIVEAAKVTQVATFNSEDFADYAVCTVLDLRVQSQLEKLIRETAEECK